jgi:hypothetical protein
MSNSLASLFKGLTTGVYVVGVASHLRRDLHPRIVEYGGRSQPPDFVPPCGVAESRPITLKRAFCSSVNAL